jgi:hypothetical protein
VSLQLSLSWFHSPAATQALSRQTVQESNNKLVSGAIGSTMIHSQPGTVETGTSTECFKHPPLNLQSATIRLIRLHAASDSNEIIECDMIVTTPDDQYTCLSYVWGDDTSGQWILVNGQKFWVRQNLWNFLNQARQHDWLSLRQFWVDALCIDQENVAERQHQVQQMGTIYGKAVQVVSWLGLDKRIVEFIDQRKDFHDIDASFYSSPYWSRAWVTQEIVLGRTVWLMARDRTSLLDELLSNTHDTSCKPACRQHFARDLESRLDYLRNLRLSPRSNTALYQLLSRFRFQKCHIRRDRIFSLLALCRLDTSIDVDYSSADIDVVINVLKSCESQFCLCLVDLITTTLGAQSPEDDDAYSFSPGQLIAHCALDLPMITADSDDFGNFHFMASSCQSKAAARCQDSRPSKIEIFPRSRRKPNPTQRRILLNLNQLCSTYCGWVVIWIDSDKSEFSYRYLGSYGGGKLMTGTNSTGDINLQTLHYNQSCRVSLSLEFWIWLAKVSERHSRPKIGNLVGRIQDEDGGGQGLFCEHVHHRRIFPAPNWTSLRLYLELKGESANTTRSLDGMS